MAIPSIVENYKRKDGQQTEFSFTRRVEMDRVDKPQRYRCSSGRCTKQMIPWASMIALLITWTGLFLFCWKIYYGLHDMEAIAGSLFREAVYYFRMGREIIAMLGIIMGVTTGAMVIVGFFISLDTNLSYQGGRSSCVCSILGSRLICGLFWTLGYVLNLCWLAILCVLVLMTSAYFCFLPICLPQSGTVDKLCFNFSMIASAITGRGEEDPHMVSLLLCGGPIDKFCKLTKAIVPWYWGAWGGCVTVIIGLSHFNSALSANFAHAKHARRYRRIRQRTRRQVRWTKDWRIKAMFISDPKENACLSTVSEAVAEREMTKSAKSVHLASSRGGHPSTTAFDSDSSITGYETEPYFDVDERRRLTRNQNVLPRTASTGSIILKKLPSTSDSFTRNMTAPCAPSYSTNAHDEP